MTPEKKIENDLRQRFINAGGYIIKFFASPNTNKGVPDLLGVLNGHFIALEVKRPHGGKPTPVQLQHLQRIANAGGYAFVTNDQQLITNLAQLRATHHPKILPITNHAILNTTSINLQQPPTPQQARDLWQTKPDCHSLQIIKKGR